MRKNMSKNDPIGVLITLPFTDELVARLKGVSDRLEVHVIEASKPEAVPPEVWATVEVLYTDRVLPKPEQAPNLRWIQFHWAGIDHALNEPILALPGLQVTTMSGASATQVAEYILMMLLALGHRLPGLLDLQARKEWPRDRWERFSPRELRGSTVGIVGYGSIGRQLARLLFAFGARVLATKRDARHPADEGYVAEGYGDPQGDYVYRLYPAQALQSMARECDFLVVAVPLSTGTKNLIGAQVFAAMKPTAYLVDVSRGGVVNQADLLDVLRERRIAGAALDVFLQEPLPAESPLWKSPNVVITPHISGTTLYYDERSVEVFAANLHRYLAALPLYNRYNPDLGY